MSKQKKTPKRRVIEHKPLELSPKARRAAKINDIRRTLQQLDELENAYVAKLQAEGKEFAEGYGVG